MLRWNVSTFVRILVALAAFVASFWTLALAATSPTGLGWLAYPFLVFALFPFVGYVGRVHGLLASVIVGVLLLAATAWWIIFGGFKLRNIDDGLELEYPFFAIMAQLGIVALTVVLQERPAPPAPSPEPGSFSAPFPPPPRPDFRDAD